MKVVAISGMIGTGKTTLCSALSQRTGWGVVREDPDKNTFLPLFYNNMERWALASQLAFMHHKTSEFQRRARERNDVLLIDRTIQEDLLVFCQVLKKYEILSKQEYLLMEQMYGHFILEWAPIDLTIYLEDSDENCFQRLLSRGNAYESKIELGYIRTVGTEYRSWRDTHLSAPFVKYDTSAFDFRKPERLDEVLGTIAERLALGAAST